MTKLEFQNVGDGVYCIDTQLYREAHTAAYLIVDNGELAFVDTGAANNVPGLLAVAAELGYAAEDVRYVLPTHVHLDHAGGAGALLDACPNATLVTHPKGVPHLIEPARLQQGAMAVYGEAEFMRVFGALVPVPSERVRAAEEEEPLPLGARNIHFIDTPGHANHHGCFYDDATAILFTGDTFGLSYREFDSVAGPWVIATTTPVAFDPETWQASLDKLAARRAAAVCVTHYGRLDDPNALLDMLRASIDGHRDIGLQDEARGADGRGPRLEAAVGDWLVAEALRRRPDMTAEHARELLALDIELNAQGIGVWLQRRAKAAGA